MNVVMKSLIRYIYLSFCLFVLLGFSACQQNAENPLYNSEETGKLTLQFSMTSGASTRGDADGVTDLFYEVKDNKLVPCEALARSVATRAVGNGNVADGGGMADLTVFLVDANDNIVARQSFGDLSAVTTQTVTFSYLRLGTYTIYAYANTEGNDWFTMPAEGETSFASYKDALLKPLDGTVSPVVGNGRMPLTGKANVTISEGTGNSARVEMKRPVGKLAVIITNNRNITVEPTSMSLGNVFPTTGYVFAHDAIYPMDAVANPYHQLPGLNADVTVVPHVTDTVYQTFLYESHPSAHIQINMSYKTEEVVVKNFTGNLNTIDSGTKIIIKLVGSELYLSVDPETKKLIMVPAAEFDKYCVWHLYGNGKQNRPIEHSVFRGYYMKPDDFSIVSSKKPNDLFLRFEGSAEQTTIDDLRYDINNNTFSINTSNPSYFQFFSVGESNTGTGGIDEDILEKIEQTETTQNLSDVHRNEFVRVHIVFK